MTTSFSKKAEMTIQRNAQGQIYSPVRAKWLFETPEERVRQEWLCVLVNEYGYPLEQIGEELDLTGRGSARARADHVIWRSKQDKRAGNTPLLIIEYKSDNITISPADYAQGEMYARLCEAPFFVTHNNKESRFWRVRKDKVPGYLEEIESIPHALLMKPAPKLRACAQRPRNCASKPSARSKPRCWGIHWLLRLTDEMKVFYASGACWMNAACYEFQSVCLLWRRF